MSLNQLGILQQLSRALMQPLIALPAAALALAFGHLLAGAGLQDTAALFELTGRTIFMCSPTFSRSGLRLAWRIMLESPLCRRCSASLFSASC